MEIPHTNNWCRWVLTVIVGGVLIPIGGWTVKTTAANQANIEVLQERLGRIERKLDRLLTTREAR